MGFVPNNWVSGDLISAAKANNTDTQFAQSVKYSEINRQTVIQGAVSSVDGTADFITGSTTALTAYATASTGEPLILSFANGNSTLGGLNYDVSLTTDSSWTGLNASNRNFLFFETSTAGAVTSSHTIIPPQYGSFFDFTQHSLIHFDGTAASTTVTDNYGSTWTNFGGAALSTAQIKFGTTSLTLTGSSGTYIETTDIVNFRSGGWTLEGWLYMTSTTANKTIISSVNDFGFVLKYNAGTGHMNLYLANSTASYDIANGSSGITTINSSAWTKWSLSYNSSTYELYIDGSIDLSVVSDLELHGVLGGIRIGQTGNTASPDPFTGYIDEFRFVRGANRYVANYTPESSAFTGDAYFFDLNKMNMYFGDPTSWTEVRKLFIGEVVTDATSVLSSLTYALKGRYDSLWFSVSPNTNYTKNHNIGIRPPGNVLVSFYFSLDMYGNDASVAHDVFFDGADASGHYNRENTLNEMRNQIMFGFDAKVQTYRGATKTAGYYRILVKRSW